jgi:serpin B
MVSEESRELQLVAIVIIGLVALGAVIAYIAPASPQGLGANEVTPEEVRSVADANTQFALLLYSSIKDCEQGQNIFFSPLSIFLALAMTYEGARGQTASEIQSVFHFPTDDAIRRSAVAEICNKLNKRSANYTLNIVNALWIQQGYRVLDEYLNMVKTYYAGKVNYVNFRQTAEKARQIINAWVENRTNNRIKDLIRSDSLDSLTRLVLTNTIYFNGTWVNQFNRERTTEEDFRVSATQTVEVPMMRITDYEMTRFNYADIDNLQILEMPYQGGNLSMLILLPKNNDIASIEDSLTLENINQWRNELTEKPIDVSIPKFNFTAQYNLTAYLNQMGMSSAFSLDADFSGIDGARNLFIRDVIQKAFVGVNEKGTEATGATAVIMTTGLNPVFRADHPFVFIIQERVTGTILFLGRVVNPTQ